jgi:hypothetical protein
MKGGAGCPPLSWPGCERCHCAGVLGLCRLCSAGQRGVDCLKDAAQTGRHFRNTATNSLLTSRKGTPAPEAVGPIEAAAVAGRRPETSGGSIGRYVRTAASALSMGLTVCERVFRQIPDFRSPRHVYCALHHTCRSGDRRAHGGAGRPGRSSLPVRPATGPFSGAQAAAQSRRVTANPTCGPGSCKRAPRPFEVAVAPHVPGPNRCQRHPLAAPGCSERRAPISCSWNTG